MMNMNIPSVGKSPSIYHGCSTWRSFWEEKSTGEENFTLGDFSAVKKKNGGCRNVRKHIEIKGSDNYLTLDTDNVQDSYEEKEF